MDFFSWCEPHLTINQLLFQIRQQVEQIVALQVLVTAQAREEIREIREVRREKEVTRPKIEY